MTLLFVTIEHKLIKLSDPTFLRGKKQNMRSLTKSTLDFNECVSEIRDHRAIRQEVYHPLDLFMGCRVVKLTVSPRRQRQKR